MRRRALLGGAGVAIVAGGAGLGVALWQRRPGPGMPPGFWSLRLPRPGGGELGFGDLRGKPALLNFWATWCPPCVTEMPLLERFHRDRQASGWQVVGIAVDQEAPVREFVARHGLTFAIVMAGATGLDLSRALGNTAAGLPFTAAFDPDGRRTATRLGPLDASMLEGWARRMP